MNSVHKPTRPAGAAAPGRHDAVRARLVDAAEAVIAEHGLAALKARDLAARAGCALGAIYTAFADMDALVMQVNARTQEALDSALQAATAPLTGADPAALLLALAEAYLEFAAAHRHRWDALFAHRMAAGQTAPQWFWDQQSAMFARVEAPVASLCPTLSPDQRRLAARSVFSAVHGIISLGLDQRVARIDTRGLRGELRRIVAALAAGLPQVK
jgi:AcrR family transcriptional regulator